MRSARWIGWLLGAIVLAVPAGMLLAGAPASAGTAASAVRRRMAATGGRASWRRPQFSPLRW